MSHRIRQFEECLDKKLKISGKEVELLAHVVSANQSSCCFQACLAILIKYMLIKKVLSKFLAKWKLTLY